MCQWSGAAALCPRGPPCVLSTATTMVSVLESRSAARQPAATPAASPADWTVCDSATRAHLSGFFHSEVYQAMWEQIIFTLGSNIWAYVCTKSRSLEGESKLFSLIYLRSLFMCLYFKYTQESANFLVYAFWLSFLIYFWKKARTVEYSAVVSGVTVFRRPAVFFCIQTWWI